MNIIPQASNKVVIEVGDVSIEIEGYIFPQYSVIHVYTPTGCKIDGSHDPKNGQAHLAVIKESAALEAK